MSRSALQASSSRLALAAAMALFLAGPTVATTTDLSDVPLASSSSAQVKPNILYIMDDSGSMAWEYMPDDLSSKTNTIGLRNSSCNYVYYNPNVVYKIPPTSTGTNVNNSSQTTFTAAYDDGFAGSVETSTSTSNKTNLSTNFQAFQSVSGNSDTSQAAYYWVYLGSNTLTPLTGDCNKTLSSSTDSTTTGYCVDDPSVSGTVADSRVTGSPPVCPTGSKLLWKKVVVSSTSGPATVDINGDGSVNSSDADERQNFANWWSYYHTRRQMMKAASARAFANVSNSYRVGYMTIHPGTFSTDGSANGSSVSSSKFLKVTDFDATQRSNWYAKLFATSGSSSTPLRTALSVAGRYFAGKNDRINNGMIPDQTDDPVQYSCQQNFAILTTDGYWNDGNGVKLDGSATMDNQDGNIAELDAYNPSGSKLAVSPRPIYDGAATTYVWNSATIQYHYTSCSYNQPQRRHGQNYQSTSQALRTIVTTTEATANIIITAANSGGNVSAVTINGADRLSSTVNAGTSSKSSTRLSNIQNGLANSGNWSGGYAPINDGSCSGTNNPVAGCVSGARYVTIKAPSGSGSVGWSLGFTASGVTLTAASFGGYTTNTSGPTAVASCSASSNTTGATTTTTSCGSNNTGPTLVDSCANQSPSFGNNYTATSCSITYTDSWTDVPTCAADPASPSNGHTETFCQSVPKSDGKKIQYQTVTTANTYPGPNQTGSIISTTSSTSSWTDVDGACYPPGSEPALTFGGAVTTVTGGGLPTPPTGCTVWPCETSSTSGGSSNTLADVAQYYYKTDLRSGSCTGALGTGTDVCANNVPGTGSGAEDDRANWQHMTTFTMGLGLSGTVAYSATYRTDTAGAFQNIRSGAADWPVPPSTGDDPTTLDDLWHAAVNGRGQYFSASNPESVITSLQSALAGINARVASAAAAATSNLEPVAGDNFVYTAKYVTQKWTGEVEAHQLDLSTGTVQSTVIWSAQAKLDALRSDACDNRTVKLFRSGAANNLVDFSLNSYACDSSGAPTGTAGTGLNSSEQAYFDSGEIAQLSQYPEMTSSQRTAAAGANLVNFLRGQKGKEGFAAGDDNKLFRARDHALGDIVNAQPVYVRGALAQYSDTGYSGYTSSVSTRTPMVYVAANDGMLHAFYAGTSTSDTQGGVEAWAIIPSMVLPNLYKLATENYASAHNFYVDGSPTAADVFDPTASADCALTSPAHPELCWKTILVGGLNKGGQGYYALDVTDPATPKGLWEFKTGACYDETSTATKAATNGADCHIGYTYGRPIVTKLSDGTWAAFVTSGINNDDGKGYLYVLNAITGKIIYRIATNTGSTASPSGLNRISAWVEDARHNNTASRVYGVDLLGDIWRFDVNDSIAPSGREATLLAQVVDSSGTPQPITTRPELAEVGGNAYVYVATGKYWGTADIGNTQTQTVWAIKDTLGTTAVTNLRSTLKQVTMTDQGSGSTAYRTNACTAQCTSAAGWYADLPDSGERVNVDMKLQLGTLIVGSNVPQNNACNIGGYSWLNYFDYRTGLAVTGTQTAQHLADALVVGLNIVRLPNGKTVTIATTSDAGQPTLETPFNVAPPSGRRVSWREVID